MSYPTGISRVHGSAVLGKNFSGVALQDFTITFAADISGDVGVADGALDRVFRTAVETIGTVSRIGSLGNGGTTLNLALEVLGADSDSPGFLGGTPNNGTTTAAALQAAIRALGTVNGYALGSATVAGFTY